jgi:hypothetical protein
MEARLWSRSIALAIRTGGRERGFLGYHDERRFRHVLRGDWISLGCRDAGAVCSHEVGVGKGSAVFLVETPLEGLETLKVLEISFNEGLR